MEINGKVYRNLEGQVAYLTEKWDDLQDQINDIKGKLTHYIVVDTLPVDPEDIDLSAVYLVGPKGTEPNTYYEEWVYVELEDESWTWEKLGDTASVDLSGYLEKVETATTYPQAYIKNPDGTQGMWNASSDVVNSALVRRGATGQISVPENPAAVSDATSKKYVVDNFLTKQSGASSLWQVYAKQTDGTQTMIDVLADGYTADTLVKRMSGGRIKSGSPTAWNDVVIKDYADDHYVAKQTGSTTYAQVYLKLADGTQSMENVADYSTSTPTIVRRVTGGQIRVPTTPTASEHAASKAYVDAAVGQLIYHHDMVIRYDDGADYVKIAAHSDNNTSTAFTNIDWHNMPLLVPDYAVYHLGGTDYMCSVVKMPYGLHQDEFSEPRDGFLITYWNGSEYINRRINSQLFTTPTVTDVVTTW